MLWCLCFNCLIIECLFFRIKANDCRTSALSQANEARTLCEKIKGLNYSAPLVAALTTSSDALTSAYHTITALITDGKTDESDYTEVFATVATHADWLKNQKPVCNSLKKAADAEVEQILGAAEGAPDADNSAS